MQEEIHKILCKCRLCGEEFTRRTSRNQFLDDVFSWSGTPKIPRLVVPHIDCPKGIGVADILGVIEEEGNNES